MAGYWVSLGPVTARFLQRRESGQSVQLQRQSVHVEVATRSLPEPPGRCLSCDRRGYPAPESPDSRCPRSLSRPGQPDPDAVNRRLHLAGADEGAAHPAGSQRRAGPVQHDRVAHRLARVSEPFEHQRHGGLVPVEARGKFVRRGHLDEVSHALGP